MKKRSRFLILGAGPAGSAAAQVLAGGGQEVTLVEASRFDKPRVGELLSPEGQESIQRLLPETYQKHFCLQIGIVGAWYHADLQRFSPPSWWTVDRLGLDRALAEAAVEAGATLHMGTRVQKLERREGVWHYQLDGASAEADWLIVATGRSGQITRLVGAQTQRFDRQVALVGFLSGKYASTHDMLLETTAKGWWYGAPIDAERSVAVFITDSDLDKGEAQAAWEARLAESFHAQSRFGHLGLIEKPARVAAGFSVLVPGFGDGWVAVGEASSAFDPLSNLGIGRAAETGEKVGEVFLKAAAEGEEPDLLLHAERIGSEFRTHSGILMDDYRKVHQFPDSVFWNRRMQGDAGEAVFRHKSRGGKTRKLLFAENQNFECTNCGKCCRGAWSATVELSNRAAILASEEVREYSGKAGFKPLRVLKDGRLATNTNPAGACIFLNEESLCNLYESPSRPRSCAQFPFLLRDTPEGVVVGVSYLCNSVQKNQGRSLESYADEIHGLLSHRAMPVLPQKIPVSWGKGVDWERCAEWEQRLLGAESFVEACRELRWQLGRWLTSDLDQVPAGGELPKEPLTELEHQMALYLLGQMEHAFFRTPKDLFDDLLENRKTQLWKVRWKGSLLDTLAETKVESLGWLDEEIERYMKALVERKFLTLNSPLYHNLLIMAALPILLRCYTAVYASVRKAPEPELEDYYMSLDRVEAEITTYGRQDKAAQTFFFWHVAFVREYTTAPTR